MLITSSNNKHIVNIEYCTQCRWLLRAAWMAQELLTTFEDQLKAVSLQPGTGGIFEVRLNGTVLFNRKDHGRFPESKELKQLIQQLNLSTMVKINLIFLELILKQVNLKLLDLYNFTKMLEKKLVH